jgi:hypothetical protein
VQLHRPLPLLGSNQDRPETLCWSSESVRNAFPVEVRFVKLFPPFRLDIVNECLWRSSEAGADERILLTPKGFEVLRYLVEHAGRLVTHRELLGKSLIFTQR